MESEKNSVVPGTLYIVATPIGNLEEITPRALRILENVDCIYCEDTRVTGKLLAYFQIKTPLVACHKFNENEMGDHVIKQLSSNHCVALVSDAGYPLISDPGYPIVNAVVENNFSVVPVSGPNAALAALVASGFNSNHFLFYGFLTSKQQQIGEELRALSGIAYPVIFYEAPHRLKFTMQALNEVYSNKRICVAKELTKLHETFFRGTVNEVFSQLQKIDTIKGEYVIVLADTDATGLEKHCDDQILFAKVNEFILQGYRLKQAVDLVASRYGISKNQLYNRFNKNKEER